GALKQVLGVEMKGAPLASEPECYYRVTQNHAALGQIETGAIIEGDGRLVPVEPRDGAPSQLKEDGGGAAQSSDLQITSAGVLVRYEWHELTPGKGQLEIIPKNDFLVERVTTNPGDKPAEQPFLMPNTSVVLDNNFLIQREVLAWRYLASSCTTEKGQMRCAPAQFGAIVPQDRTSTRLNVQPVGEEKVTIRGVERQLLRLNLKSEDDEWGLWLDPQDHYKLIRVTKSGENSEVVRD
ncbi:MAG: hypothetical protein LAN63_13475, partial [Acidobacteriia bacterium]|nr:hypothetical protein [Terriglobia bacterium]